MADTEQVSSTTPNEEPKVEASQGMGDVALTEPGNEAEAKVVEKEVSDIAVEHKDTPQEPPMETTDLSPPPSVPKVLPETVPQAPAVAVVTSTTEDATEKLIREAVTEAAAPAALAHTEETAVEKPTESIVEPAPVIEEKASVDPVVTTPKVEENHTPEVTEPIIVPEPEVEAPAPVAAPVVEEPVVESAPPEPAPVVVEKPVIVVEEPPKVAAPIEEPIVVEPPKVEEPIPVPEPTKVAEPVEEAAPTSYEPALPAPAPPQPLMQFSGEHWSSSLLASQDSAKVSMDSDTKDMTSGRSDYDHDLLGGSDDDLPFEMQKSPFQGINQGDGMSSGFSHFEDEPVGGRTAQMSESPTPDLVQYAHDGDMLDCSPFQNLEKAYDPIPVAPPVPAQQPFSSSLQFSTTTAEEVEPGLPPVLPDILKSSPLNPDKVDSGSSEGSPDPSPVHRRGTESPNIPMSLSANNPFSFDTKISLLAEMAEETEARAAAKAKIDEEEQVTEQSFGAFDLVKEAKDTQDVKLPQDEFKDWNPSSQDSAKVADKFECLNFPSGKAQEDSDSESPSADSLSPVLEAMAKNPASFQVESDKVIPKDKEVVEAAEEASEQEVSSEEFEFVERPPRGAIDEFLETLDSTKFSKTSELLLDEEPATHFKQEDHMTAVSSTSQEMTTSQSSYLLLTEPSGKSSPQRSKAGLELADVQESFVQTPVSQTHTGPAKMTAERSSVKIPSMSVGAVVDLLYWRDVKATGVVFGANLLLLLSLTMCSIISVLSYVALALLSITITFRIYKGILQAIQKSDEGHPFKLYLDKEVTLSEDMVHKYSDVALGRINSIVIELRRLFLVEDLVDSLKFAVCMWILTYIGALFNGLTLLILGLIAAFSCPIVYEKHQTQIDQYLSMVNNQIKDIVGKVQAKVPGLKKKSE